MLSHAFIIAPSRLLRRWGACQGADLDLESFAQGSGPGSAMGVRAQGAWRDGW